jgi:HK97 family phage portal protein
VSIFESLRTYLKSKDMNERALTPAQVWGRGGMWQPYTKAGVKVNAETAMEAAMGACVRLLADDISSLPVDVITKVGGYSQSAPRPPWLELPTGHRWDTFQAYLSDVVVSMLTDGNAFIECLPDTNRPLHFRVHDPETIKVEPRGKDIVYSDGRQSWNELQMAHIPWVRLPGALRALAPLDAARESTGIEVAARRWESAFFSNGATTGTVISHPGKPTADEVELMRTSFNDRHQGADKAFGLGIITGGAKLTDGVVKPQDAALEALWRRTVEEAARFFHVPPHLLGSQESGAVSYASVEQRSLEYVTHALLPITTRIEYAHGRFLRDGEQLKINVNALLRGDIKARSDWYRTALMNKVMRPAEVRALEDLPFDAENTGYLETPNNNVPDAYVEQKPDAAGITITGELRGEAEQRIASAVAQTVGAGMERIATDVNRQFAQVGVEMAQMRRHQQQRLDELPVETKPEPEVTHIQRDDDGRPTDVYTRRGDAVSRKSIRYDENGRLAGFTEEIA